MCRSVRDTVHVLAICRILAQSDVVCFQEDGITYVVMTWICVFNYKIVFELEYQREFGPSSLPPSPYSSSAKMLTLRSKNTMHRLGLNLEEIFLPGLMQTKMAETGEQLDSDKSNSKNQT